jgi:ABC-2 type transport system permease protein
MVFVGFLKPAGFLALVAEGFPGTNGAEQAVPGAAATFSLFVTGLVGLSFFREHGWGTWPRLRASPAGTAQILAGKLIPLVAFSLVQLALIFGAGFLFFGLHVRGSVGGLVVASVAVALCSVALGVALVAVCRSLAQLNALANLGTALLAGLGGALMPLRLLPGWVRAIGPGSPAYWSMKAYRAVILDGASPSGILRPCAFLLAFTAAFTVIALVAFSTEERKTAWA